MGECGGGGGDLKKRVVIFEKESCYFHNCKKASCSKNGTRKNRVVCFKKTSCKIVLETVKNVCKLVRKRL